MPDKATRVLHTALFYMAGAGILTFVDHVTIHILGWDWQYLIAGAMLGLWLSWHEHRIKGGDIEPTDDPASPRQSFARAERFGA